jgi:hypothetical protein
VYLNGKRLTPEVYAELVDDSVISLGPVDKADYRWTVKLTPPLESSHSKRPERSEKRESDLDSTPPSRKRVKFDDTLTTAPLSDSENVDKTTDSRVRKKTITKCGNGDKTATITSDCLNGDTATTSSEKSGKDDLTTSPKSAEAKETTNDSSTATVISKLRTKFNEELSCSICNEVFISVSFFPPSRWPCC